MAPRNRGQGGHSGAGPGRGSRSNAQGQQAGRSNAIDLTSPSPTLPQTGRSNVIDLTSPPPTLPPSSLAARQPQIPSYDMSDPEIAARARDLQTLALGPSDHRRDTLAPDYIGALTDHLQRPRDPALQKSQAIMDSLTQLNKPLAEWRKDHGNNTRRLLEPYWQDDLHKIKLSDLLTLRSRL
ncbi:hypothetical protein LTR10_013062 [Elasticomyces elasticus]|uniref:Uncharacterized protein n=1 Tax=Exophiala sideris TaxID=1016849 RepID=A0ABR0JBB1_9EURO|nr:hypothetical protein LTR10_013062 [Elasticomyces elasticus]KAK5030438.1 hypothetical protein LTS07_005222 [Exophiala sideris]KAK5038491.1 hypothetical protein LTR13_004238 [Exophiala sideris]KAK5060374.1 hypothetical protein LTR69_005691 [Exophiala sideris]KAK5183284.1 hypothetical protein LTR44_004285 [Eurotiomycetes sp. CCFEE 6388]